MTRIGFSILFLMQILAVDLSAQQKSTATKPAGPKPAPAKLDGAKLIAGSDCFACHDMKDKKIGPAYLDIAKKYTITPQNVDNLGNKILKGGKGVWGEIPMAPHPNLKKEEVNAMAKYIIGLDKK